ncbi:DUF1631 family protein [Acidovorax sp. M2(2025)]|uniref:DUF1631 family protein n=1 Tax=Acidovorax sp. M2(2025) TaxID=3411355 RepID=UPI003BF5C7B8
MASHLTPPPALAPPAPPGAGPRERIVQDLLAEARPLLERVADAARTALQARLDQARTPGEHQAFQVARQQLMRLTPVMAERYPEALRQALGQDSAQAQEKGSRSLFSIHFDELELMDETAVNESVERARARQMVMTAVEAPLADLDALVCAALALPRVQPEANPLRPDIFLQALQTVVSQMQLNAQVRHDWMGPMAHALGQELRTLYHTRIEQLKQGGVQPVGYAMRQTDGQVIYVSPASGDASPGFASDNDRSTAASGADPLLTLDRLRRLLLGEFSAEPAPPEPPAGAGAAGTPVTDSESFADRFAREFDAAEPLPQIDAPATDFAMTVPAAFEALQEMNQVGQMMERLGSPRPAGSASAAVAPTPSARLGQTLSMEVVALMVDNIARDSRLLWPVQQFIRALEPALMQLVLADPRFFSNKDHPARRLLQDITDQSLAFNSTEAPGFQSFMRSLMNIAGPLASETVEGPDDFERVLAQLHAKWAEKDQARQQEQLRAIEALQHAEQRHALAAHIAREIAPTPGMDRVPEPIVRFLLGPWAQVLAQAQLADTAGSADPGRYRELVEALLWSAQPELTRGHTGQLARLLPKLLPKLREGLATIDYPPDRTEEVFGLLMELHQQAFRPGPRLPAQSAPPAPADAAPSAPQPPLLDEDTPWVAPAEARDSGYMDIAEPAGAEPVQPQPVPAATPTAAPLPPLVIGTWVNLRAAGEWQRTQLSWIGSQGTLFLFTAANGRTQSMTLRLLERLFQQGALQILSEQAVVDGALDAVAQLAMRNSVESQL